MPRLTALFETTQREYQLPVWRTDRTAAMAHLSCAFTWGTDPIEPLRPQMPAICEYLLSLPEHLRCLYLYGIGVAGVKAWNGSPKHDWTTGKQPDPSIGNAQSKYIASYLGERGVVWPLNFTDYEEPHFLPDGRYAPQSSRVKYMKAVLAPLMGEKINFNFVRFPPSKPVTDGNGTPHGQGVISRTSNPCAYANNMAEWAKARRDVENCIGPVIPHLPSRWSKDKVPFRAPSVAVWETAAAIISDAKVGVTQWTIGAYEFESPPDADFRPLLVQSACCGLEYAEAITTQDGVNS